MERPSTRALATLALLVALPLSAVARPTTAQLVARAGEQVDGGDFEGAIVTLDEGLASPDVSDGEVSQLSWKMGEVYVFLGREADAKATFDRLLYVSPAFEAPRLTAPRVKKAFDDEKRAFVAEKRRIVVEVPLQAAPRANRPVQLEVRVRGLREGFRVRSYFRRALSEAWQSADVDPSEDDPALFLADWPAFPGGTTVEFYVEVTGADHRRIVSAGSALSPKTLSVLSDRTSALPAPVAVAAEPPASHAWVWVVVAVVVVGGGVATWVALRPSPATLNLRVEVTP